MNNHCCVSGCRSKANTWASIADGRLGELDMPLCKKHALMWGADVATIIDDHRKMSKLLDRVEVLFAKAAFEGKDIRITDDRDNTPVNKLWSEILELEVEEV